MFKEIQDDSDFIEHVPCPVCGSSDACAVYSDGHAYCFSCGEYTPADGEPQRSVSKSKADFAVGEQITRTIRGITPETFQKWRYTRNDDTHIANHYRDGQLVGQKLRKKGKKFNVIGKMEPLYGMWLWKEGGRKVVVTEGELDALSMSQVQGNKWPVVSVPNGAQGAKKSFQAAYDWLETFDQVVIMFDNDKPGSKAALECAQLLTPGKAAIAELPLKDPNEMLKVGRGDELVTAMWQAKTYRPDGIVTLDQLKDEALKPTEMGRSWPFPTLTEATYGRRDGEVIYVGAGTGIGKSDFIAENVKHDLCELQMPVGVLFLEQDPVETVKRIAGKFAGKRFHVPDGTWTAEELAEAIDLVMNSGKLFLYDNFGAIDWNTVESRLKYMIVSCGCKHIYLDHLTALVAQADDERRELESVTADLAMIAKKHNVTIHVVSHLATPEGKPHEEGGRVMLRHFKGSRSIGYWGHFAIGLERNQQAEDEDERHTTTVRILKDRYTGQATGQTFNIKYNHAEGRLTEIVESPFGDGEEDEGDPF